MDCPPHHPRAAWCRRIVIIRCIFFAQAMPRLAANLSLLYPEWPFLQRFAAAARSGFDAVECQFPYGHDLQAIAAELKAHALTLVLHNLPAGDWAAGDRGLAALPERVSEFRDGVGEALKAATTLGTPRLNALAGVPAAGIDSARVRATLVSNLRFAAAELRSQGLTLLIEPINTHDVPGFWLHGTHQALELIDEVGEPNLRLQLDLYHADRMGEDLRAVLREAMPLVGHLQMADNPGRHEPGTGRMPMRALFDLIDELGYTGHVGCEYLPLNPGPGGTDAGLVWRQALGRI